MRSTVDQLPIELVKIFNKRKNNSSSLEMVLSDTEDEETSIQESLFKFIKKRKRKKKRVCSIYTKTAPLGHLSPR